PRVLTVAVTSRALFDLEEGHSLFEREGVDAYAEYQRQLEDEILEPGVAFPVVRKLLALNQRLPEDAPQVEVILLSRNSADTGLRIFNSIQIGRASCRERVGVLGAGVGMREQHEC